MAKGLAEAACDKAQGFPAADKSVGLCCACVVAGAAAPAAAPPGSPLAVLPGGMNAIAFPRRE